MQDKNLEQMEKATIPRAILTLGLPTVFSSVMTLLYNPADTYFIGLMNSLYHLSAAHLAYPIFIVVQSIGNILGIGASPYISRCLGEDNALGTIEQDRYEQMSQKYSEEYYTLKTELAEIKEQLSAFENAGGRAQRSVKLTERYADFAELTPAILNEFISRIEVHERDQKRARYMQAVSVRSQTCRYG